MASVVKVLQRSLFRAPVHEHYGTGIASGLVDRPGYAVGGRVNLKQGGDPDIADIIAEGKALQSKEELFDGRTKITSAPGSFGFLSILGQDYQLQLFKKIREQGLDKETFKSLPREQQELIAQRLNDEIFNNMATKYSVSLEQLDEHFGGKMVINNALKSIQTQFNYPQASLEKNMLSLEENYQDNFASLQEENPGILDPLPSVAQQQPTEDPDMGDLDTTDDDDDAADVMQAGLMGLDRTQDEFRKRYVEYLQNLQDDTDLADIRRREAVEAGFFNLGAADPVQPGESLVQAGIKAFRDPMANLRAQEAVRAEDIYKRGADVLDQALSPSDSANVLLIQDLVEAGIPRPQAIDMVTGLSQQRSAAFLEALQDPNTNIRISDIMKANPGMSRGRAAELAIGFDFPQSAEEIVAQQQQQANLGAQTITQQGITAPKLGMGEGGKDGGRVGLQQGGQPLSEAVTQEQMAPAAIDAGSPTVEAMSFDELREKLPSYISDEVVKLLSENPMALMELAQAQTDRDLKEFEKKYKVDVTMPQAESEVDYTGAV